MFTSLSLGRRVTTSWVTVKSIRVTAAEPDLVTTQHVEADVNNEIRYQEAATPAAAAKVNHSAKLIHFKNKILAIIVL